MAFERRVLLRPFPAAPVRREIAEEARPQLGMGIDDQDGRRKMTSYQRGHVGDFIPIASPRMERDAQKQVHGRADGEAPPRSR